MGGDEAYSDVAKNLEAQLLLIRGAIDLTYGQK